MVSTYLCVERDALEVCLKFDLEDSEEEKMYAETSGSFHGASLKELEVGKWLIGPRSNSRGSKKYLLVNRIVTAFLLLLVLFPPVTLAQGSSSTGVIQGTVEDSTGAVLAGATVTLTNPVLSLQRETKSRSDGTYVFPLLQPASGYQVAVEQAGFSRVLLQDLTVLVTETTVANVTLSVGAVAEQVSVTGSAQIVDTTSSALGGVISSKVITSLPLPTRSVLDLMGTDAGVYAPLDSPAQTITQGNNAIYASGARSFSNNYLLNGTSANNYEFETLGGGVVPIPDPDAIQEFRTQTSLADATSGIGNGATISLVTRQGTTKYHGVAYEFVRNTDFNANDFFLNAAGSPRPILQQNQFGGSFGGAVPKIHSTFFFVNYEGLRQVNGVAGTSTGSLPVLPASRDAASLATAFGLPTAAIDPVAVNLLNAKGAYGGYLIPSGTGAPLGTLGTYAFSSPSYYNTNQESVRLDHEFSSKNHAYIAGFFSSGPFSNPTGSGGSSTGQGYEYVLGSQNVSINDTHIFRANLINDFVIGWTRAQRDILALPGYVSLGNIGMTRSNSSVTDLLPAFSISNQMAFSSYPNVQHPQHAQTFDIRDAVSWIKGKHTFRFGFETTRGEYNDGIYVPRGSLSFSTAANKSVSDLLYGLSPLGSSGDLSFRDFLIGAPSTVTDLSGIQAVRLRSRDYAVFAQDDYRVTKRLTLNLGLRYDHLGFPTEVNNLLSNFDPSLLSPAALATGGAGLQAAFVVAGQNGVSSSTMLRPNYGNLSPRIGFAYDVFGNGRLAVRGGYGLYYQPPDYALVLANSGNPPYQISTSSTPTYASAASTKQLANPFPVLPLPSAFPIWPTFPTLTGLAASGAPTSTQPLLTGAGIDRNNKVPYGENWNFTIQGQFAKGWTLEVAYLGANGIHQEAFTQPNNGLFVNAATPGRFGITTNSSANRDARVPYAGLSSTGLTWVEDAAQTWYNALAVTVTHPFTKSFLVKVAYTYSKSLDDYQSSGSANYSSGSNEGNPFDLSLNRGVSEQNIPNRFVATYVWNLPGPKTGVLGYIVGHWTLSGISTYQNGLPGTISQSIGTSSLTGTTGFGVVQPGCQLVASGPVADHLNNYLNSACVSAQPLLASGATFGPTSPYGTAGNQTYTVGTGGGRLIGTPTYGAFYAPFQRRDDVSLSKNFPLRFLGESGNLEFRAEAFKILNNVIFSAPASAAGASTFGKITSTTDSTGRQLQFGLKLGF
jgi:hypothetical protein